MKALQVNRLVLLFLLFGSTSSYSPAMARRTRRGLSTSQQMVIENDCLSGGKQQRLTEKDQISFPSHSSMTGTGNHVVTRSLFCSTVALASLMAPISALALTPESTISTTTTTTIPSRKGDFTTQRMNKVNQNTVPNQVEKEEGTGSSSFQESISEFVAGAALAVTKTLVKYPLDTVTVRLQVPNNEYSVSDLGKLFSGTYNGVTASLLSNIPGGAVFFAVKGATKTTLKQSVIMHSAPAWITTALAVGTALIPFWAIRNPSEVIKVRQQVGIDGYGDDVSAWDALQLTLNTTAGNSVFEGIGTLYTGYWENILYSLPADVIKFGVYESLTGGRKNFSPMEGARAGALSTAFSQLVTTPLDVVRNRLMTEGRVEPGDSSDTAYRSNYMDRLVKLGKEEGLAGLFAGATPRVAKAILSGAIQFATYEETKQSFARFLQNR